MSAFESTTKTCTGCGRELPATLDFFKVRKGRPCGMRSQCRDCERGYNTVYSVVYRKLNRDKAIAYHALYRAAHLSEKALRAADYRAANRETIAVGKAAYYLANKERVKAQVKKSAADNPERVRANGHAKRARKRSATGSHTGEDIKAQYKRQKGKCFYCGVKVGEQYHVDHVIPLALGGSDGPENLVVACLDCNQTKHAKHPMDFAGIMF